VPTSSVALPVNQTVPRKAVRLIALSGAPMRYRR
jgi:hypothetical protein